MADEETLDERFLRTFYVLAEGQATQLVSGEELARKPGMDPDGETDKARFLGTARRLEEGYVIANKTGPEERDNTSLSSTQQASSRRSRRAGSHSTSRASWGGDGGSELRSPSGGPRKLGQRRASFFARWSDQTASPVYSKWSSRDAEERTNALDSLSRNG